MSDFPYQHHHSLLDSIFLPNTPIIKNVSMEDANLSTIHFSQFHRPEPLYEDPLDVSFLEGGHNICHCSKIAVSDSETSVTKKQNTDSSTVVADRLESGEQITQNVSPLMKKRQNANGSSWNSSAQSKDDREKKSKKQKKSDGEMNKEQKKPKSETKDQKKIPEEASTGYIHVRARRGEATDSHSLAERARRQKISERMKMLQGLVPGCDKVTGKAQMLDEIINYVQYLQNQVEFLSMKLASVNPLFYDIGMELDPFAIGPERLSSLQASTLPGVEQCSPTQATAFAVANTIAAAARPGNSVTANNYPVVDCAAALLLQGHEDSGLWDEDEQRQKLINPSGFSGNWSSF